MNGPDRLRHQVNHMLPLFGFGPLPWYSGGRLGWGLAALRTRRRFHEHELGWERFSCLVSFGLAGTL